MLQTDIGFMHTFRSPVATKTASRQPGKETLQMCVRVLVLFCFSF